MSIILDFDRFEQHISVTSTDLIKEVSRPFLEKHQLTHFSHGRNFTDGGLYTLTTEPKLYKYVMKHKLYSYTKFHYTRRHFDRSCFIWAAVDEREKIILQHVDEHYHIGNGITLIRNYAHHQDHYHFATKSGDEYTSIYNFYINNLDLLNAFIDQYELKVAKIITQCDQQRLVIPNCYAPNIAERLNNKNLPVFELLSKQEYTCLRYIGAGFSAKEAAEALNLSHRTVESYLSNARRKYDCRNTAALVKLIFDSVS